MVFWSKSCRKRGFYTGLLGLATGCTVSWQPTRDSGFDSLDGDVFPGRDAAVAESDGASVADAAVTPPPDGEAKRADPPDAGCIAGAACDAPPPPGPVRATGFEGASCTPEGAETCVTQAGTRRLRCTSGRLRFAEPCAMGTLCDTANDASTTGQCRAIGMCDAVDDSGVGCVGDVRVQCDATGRGTALLPCAATSHCERAGECVCDLGLRPSADGTGCESFEIGGVFGTGGAGAYCATDAATVLGDPAGFWVAILFRTFQAVARPAALASQRSPGAGRAFTETPDGLRFDLADAARGPAPGAYATADYVRPLADTELALTQLAVAVFTGREGLLYVGDRLTGPAVAASFAVPSAGLCVLGEPSGDGVRGTASSVVSALVGGSPAPTADEVHALFAATKQNGGLAGIGGKTAFVFDFAGNSPMTVPVRVDNRGGPAVSLVASGFVGPATALATWAW